MPVYDHAIAQPSTARGYAGPRSRTLSGGGSHLTFLAISDKIDINVDEVSTAKRKLTMFQVALV
ncbi:hypothetical protein DXG01_013788, partial [Tephrocybe rancida]